MGESHERQFWLDGDDEYQRLAKAYEEHIDLTHPEYVTRRIPWGCGYMHDAWYASKVIYPEYRGPQIKHL